MAAVRAFTSSKRAGFEVNLAKRHIYSLAREHLDETFQLQDDGRHSTGHVFKAIVLGAYQVTLMTKVSDVFMAYLAERRARLKLVDISHAHLLHGNWQRYYRDLRELIAELQAGPPPGYGRLVDYGPLVQQVVALRDLIQTQQKAEEAYQAQFKKLQHAKQVTETNPEEAWAALLEVQQAVEEVQEGAADLQAIISFLGVRNRPRVRFEDSKAAGPERDAAEEAALLQRVPEEALQKMRAIFQQSSVQDGAAKAKCTAMLATLGAAPDDAEVILAALEREFLCQQVSRAMQGLNQTTAAREQKLLQMTTGMEEELAARFEEKRPSVSSRPARRMAVAANILQIFQPYALLPCVVERFTHGRGRAASLPGLSPAPPVGGSGGGASYGGPVPPPMRVLVAHFEGGGGGGGGGGAAAAAADSGGGGRADEPPPQSKTEQQLAEGAARKAHFARRLTRQLDSAIVRLLQAEAGVEEARDTSKSLSTPRGGSMAEVPSQPQSVTGSPSGSLFLLRTPAGGGGGGGGLSSTAGSRAQSRATWAPPSVRASKDRAARTPNQEIAEVQAEMAAQLTGAHEELRAAIVARWGSMEEAVRSLSACGGEVGGSTRVAVAELHAQLRSVGYTRGCEEMCVLFNALQVPCSEHATLSPGEMSRLGSYEHFMAATPTEAPKHGLVLRTLETRRMLASVMKPPEQMLAHLHAAIARFQKCSAGAAAGEGPNEEAKEAAEEVRELLSTCKAALQLPGSAALAAALVSSAGLRVLVDGVVAATSLPQLQLAVMEVVAVAAAQHGGPAFAPAPPPTSPPTRSRSSRAPRRLRRLDSPLPSPAGPQGRPEGLSSAPAAAAPLTAREKVEAGKLEGHFLAELWWPLLSALDADDGESEVLPLASDVLQHLLALFCRLRVPSALCGWREQEVLSSLTVELIRWHTTPPSAALLRDALARLRLLEEALGLQPGDGREAAAAVTGGEGQLHTLAAGLCGCRVLRGLLAAQPPETADENAALIRRAEGTLRRWRAERKRFRMRFAAPRRPPDGLPRLEALSRAINVAKQEGYPPPCLEAAALADPPDPLFAPPPPAGDAGGARDEGIGVREVEAASPPEAGALRPPSPAAAEPEPPQFGEGTIEHMVAVRLCRREELEMRHRIPDLLGQLSTSSTALGTQSSSRGKPPQVPLFNIKLSALECQALARTDRQAASRRAASRRAAGVPPLPPLPRPQWLAAP